MKHPAAITVIAIVFALPVAADAAPTTVQLRVEGSSQTIFEGPVTTDAKSIDGHPCDGTNGGVNPTAGPTMTSALDDAAATGSFTWDRTFFGGFDDFGIDRIGPDATDLVNFRFWGYSLNYVVTNVGGCQQRIQPGDEVLFGYDFFSKSHLLELAGPNKATTGSAVSVEVTDGGSGTPLDGVTVADQTTDGAGRASLTFTSPGVYRLKAQRSDSLRSNALEICVFDAGASSCDGFTPSVGPGVAAVRDRSAPTASISGIRNGARLRRGPKLLKGTASDAGNSGLKTVKLSLRRHRGGRCGWWSATAERFSGGSCEGKVFFSIGNRRDWSYQLARALGPGHYVLDVKARDGAGNLDASFARGRSRIVFDVIGGVRNARASKRKAAAKAQVMVVGKSGEVLSSARTVIAKARTVRASGRRCLVGASTPLSALVAATRGGSSLSLKDFGRCSRTNARDAAQLFVNSIGNDANRGADGWVYKLRDRIASLGAGDRMARVRSGDRLLWFYCVHDPAGHCQPTLRVEAQDRVPVSNTVRVRALKVDDDGHAIPAAGVTLSAGGQPAVSGTDGSALLPTPAQPGPVGIVATLPGAITSFPQLVEVEGAR